MKHPESLILIRHLASIQQRIGAQTEALHRQLRTLEHDLMQARVQHIITLSRLAWLTTTPTKIVAPATPPLPPQEHLITLKALRARIASPETDAYPADKTTQTLRTTMSALAAEVVICQTGCLSQDAYWRVKEACRRMGKRCIFVAPAEVESMLERALDR